jgi:hypothetical protein
MKNCHPERSRGVTIRRKSCLVFLPVRQAGVRHDIGLVSLIWSLVLFIHILPAQIIPGVALFPDTIFIRSFPADAHAHRMSVENLILSKNLRASMGSTIPVVSFKRNGINAQASFGASVHFELRPIGQAQISSNDYYVDFLILDVAAGDDQFIRFVTGHTSHHLSDNWYERLQLNGSVRYSRDYLKLFYIYSSASGSMLYLGADYAYIFTVGQKISKPWTLQGGGEAMVKEFSPNIYLSIAADVKVRQEAGFAATNTLQIGVTMPMRIYQRVRLAYQYRFGLDERGQFFPQHRPISTIGLYFEL